MLSPWITIDYPWVTLISSNYFFYWNFFLSPIFFLFIMDLWPNRKMYRFQVSRTEVWIWHCQTHLRKTRNLFRHILHDTFSSVFKAWSLTKCGKALGIVWKCSRGWLGWFLFLNKRDKRLYYLSLHSFCSTVSKKVARWLKRA